EIGAWRFRTETRDLANDADLDAFARSLHEMDAKDRTVLRLVLRGTVTLRQNARLDAMLDHARDLFAAIDLWQRHSNLAIVPESSDFADLALSGFAQRAADKLRAQAADADAATARDARALLVRLAGAGA